MRKLLSILYAAVIRRRNRRFDTGRSVQRVSVPVISIGNVSVGGSGKTPLTRLIVSMLIAGGHRPSIVSRGYGRRSRGVVVVRDRNNILADVQQSGDELQMLAQSLCCPIIASEIRYLGATRAVREFDVDCIVLDDAFQHRQLHRDCDIVIVDRNTLDNAQVMPAGVLREDLSALGRADLLCLTKDVDSDEIRNLSTVPLVHLRMNIRGVFDLRLKQKLEIPSHAFAVSAIAQPERFELTITELGIRCTGSRYFRDHYFYRSEDVARIIREAKASGCTLIVTTEKDAVKLQVFQAQFDSHGCSVAVLCIEAQTEEVATLQLTVDRVFQEFEETERHKE